MGLRLKPCSVKAAQAYVRQYHRHLPVIQGGMFAAAVANDNGICGVAIAGHGARVWADTGRIVITRVATDQSPNACSMLYGAMARAAKALGYVEIWTYTLPDEPGSSLRAAGFRDMGMGRGGEWTQPSRARAPAVRPEPKRRWMRQLAESQRQPGTSPASGEVG